MKRALITGITGQDGSYLAEFLLGKGYEVHGIKRRSSLFNTKRIDHIYQDPYVENSRFKLHYGDLSDTSNLTRILRDIEPDEVYNLGAQSHVAVSFESPEYTADVDGRHLRMPRPSFSGRAKQLSGHISSFIAWCGNTAERDHPFSMFSWLPVLLLLDLWNYERHGIYLQYILFNHVPAPWRSPKMTRA